MDLKEYLYINDISAKDFAALLGLSYTTVYNYLRGEHRPTRKVAMKIEKLTNGIVPAVHMRKIRKRKKREKHVISA